MFNFFPYIIKRAVRHWQLLLTLSLGVILATSLLASGPLLVDTVIQLGLRSALSDANPLMGNILVTSTSVNFTEDEYLSVDEQFKSVMDENIGEYISQTHQSIHTRWLYPWEDSVLHEDHRIQFCLINDIEEKIVFVEGDWPRSYFPEKKIVQGVISEKMGEAYNLSVGDLLPLSLDKDNEEPDYWLEVSGVIRPKNWDDPYWFGEENPLLDSGQGMWESQFLIILSTDVFYEVNSFIFDRPLTVIKWRVLIEHSFLRVDNLDILHSKITNLSKLFIDFPIRISASTNIDQVIVDFSNQASTVRAPLYLLISQSVLLILYYVVMVSALAVRQVEREFAILGSRGAGGNQILRVQISEALIISGMAILSGPILGLGMIEGLIQYGPLKDVAQSGWSLSFTAAAWLAAIIGAVSSLLGLLLPVRSSVKRSIVTQTRTVARSSGKPFWQRLYLDVFVLLVGLIFFVRMRMYGGIAGETQNALDPTGGIDWLLLLSPLALMVGSATILLRIFPMILKLLEKISTKFHGLTSVLAFWQSARNPDHVARLVLLLTLAMSLGIFSTGLNATLDRSEFERSQYAAGTDARLINNGIINIDQYIDTSKIISEAKIYRGSGSLRTRPFPKFEVMAIEPKSIAQISHFRSDYSEIPMGQLLSYLSLDDFTEPPTYPLPGIPASIGIWIWDELDDDNRGYMLMGLSDLDRVRVGLKLKTANGDYYSVRLSAEGADNEVGHEAGNYPEGGWQYFSANLLRLTDKDYPLSVSAIWFQNRAARTRTIYVQDITLSFIVDDLMVVDERTGEELIVTSFENPAEIWSVAQPQSYVSYSKQLGSHSGEASLRTDLTYVRSFDYVGVSLPSSIGIEFLPALVSPKFLEASGLKVGDRSTVSIYPAKIIIEIKGVVNYFPTLFEDLPAGFIITQREPLLVLLNNTPEKAINVNETWLRTDEDTVKVLDQAAQERAEIKLITADDIRRSIKADPMALGLRSVTSFGFIITTILSLVGFATYFYISARQRETNYGILRALGLSPSQLYQSLVWEQVVLIFAGLALGTGLGILINMITLSGLPIALGDQASVPPFVPKSNWYAVGQIYINLAVAFILTLGIATVLLWRAKIHRVLRIGEE